MPEEEKREIKDPTGECVKCLRAYFILEFGGIPKDFYEKAPKWCDEMLNRKYNARRRKNHRNTFRFNH
jgi:hypothetical protein